MKAAKMISWVLPWCLALTSFTTQAETRYIASQKAKVLQEPNFQASPLTEMSKGDAIEVLSTQGVWLNVKVKEQSGWISKFLVSPTPPIEKVTVLPGDDETSLKDVRRRTSAITTAAAARGLAASAAQEDTQYTENLPGVVYMESFKVSDAELKTFEQAILGGSK